MRGEARGSSMESLGGWAFSACLLRQVIGFLRVDSVGSAANIAWGKIGVWRQRWIPLRWLGRNRVDRIEVGRLQGAFFRDGLHHNATGASALDWTTKTLGQCLRWQPQAARGGGRSGNGRRVETSIDGIT